MDIPTVKRFSENGKLFLRAFLLDATKNNNGWKVVAANIRDRIKSFIGAPLLLTEDYSHPPYDYTKKPLENAEAQERFAIGRIRDVVEKEGIWDAIIEITNSAAKEAIEAQDIPFFTSPKLLYNKDEPLDKISDWTALHLAVVDKPAYGDKAIIKGECYGSGEQCRIALAEAKTDCGFCVKTALTKLVTNHNDSSLTSLETETRNLQTEMVDTPQVIDTSKFVSKEDYDKQIAQVEVLKVAVTAAKANYEKELDALKEERRKEKITATVEAKISDKAKAAEAIKKFVDAKASPELVAEAMSYIPEPKRDNTELYTAQVEAKKDTGSWFRTYQSNESKIIRGARA